MKKNTLFRLATKEDAKEILEIYRYYIENTTITFEYDVPTIKEFEKRIEDIEGEYPYIVCLVDDRIVAYAYAHKVWERAAYQWDVELSVYTDKDYVGNGFGKKMYNILIDILRLQNVINIYGCVTFPNENSEKLHNYLGFKKNGVFTKAGYKFGKWLDVMWFEKAILEHRLEPKPVKRMDELEQERVKEILNKY